MVKEWLKSFLEEEDLKALHLPITKLTIKLMTKKEAKQTRQ